MPEAISGDTIILCLGNLLRGDDGVGIAIYQEMTQRSSLPETVTLVDAGTPGLETVLLLQGYRRAIIIDAAEMEKQPGEWLRFDYQDAVLQPADMALRGTLHSAGLAEALTLGEALGILPEEIVIYGIQPQSLGQEPGLSEPVQAAIPAICEAVIQEVTEAK